MKRHLGSWVLLAAAGAALFLVGRWSGSAPDGSSADDAVGSGTQAAAVWTCPMHPQIKLPEFGSCPICGMDLVALGGDGQGDSRQLVLSPAEVELARVRTTEVRRADVVRPVRLVGKVDYDETAARTISAWVPGRLDRLFVDYTGVRVNEGDHLVRLYSPDLLTAQEELLSSRSRLSATGGESSEFLADSNARAYRSAREKLILWGLTPEQVGEIEARGTAEEHVMLTSPTSGVVIEKLLEQGAYVETGTHIYKIADLSHLWVQLDAYEQDLTWLRYGQDVALEAEAYPGELFGGRISFIDPIVQELTRTVKVRVNVDNADGRLKPGMFVRAVVQARLGSRGAVLDQALAGKWVSPMHPEIVKDVPGSCDVCGMDLVAAEELGLVSVDSGEQPLVIPSSAALITGRRAVVYVEVPGAERPTYEGREVLLGPRAGDLYVVRSGLVEGERVVSNGTFRIDSSMQILARPSMMSLPGGNAGHAGPEVSTLRAELSGFFDRYIALQVALAADDTEAARAAVARLGQGLIELSDPGLQDHAAEVFAARRAELQAGQLRADAAVDLDALRAAFEELSTGVLGLAREFGAPEGSELYEVHCPMAFGERAASWMQSGEQVANPYLGDAMLRCGSARRIGAGGGQ